MVEPPVRLSKAKRNKENVKGDGNGEEHIRDRKGRSNNTEVEGMNKGKGKRGMLT